MGAQQADGVVCGIMCFSLTRSIDLGEFFKQFGDGRAGAEGDFLPRSSWEGAKAGYCYRKGYQGLGYYLDVGLENRCAVSS